MTTLKLLSFFSAWFFLVGCAFNPSNVIITKETQYPNLERDDILKKWGYPHEVLIHKNGGKRGSYITTWIYYLQDHEGDVFPVFFTYHKGQPIATTAFGQPEKYYRVMNTDKLKDLKTILEQKNKIKNIWPIWENN